MTHAPALLLSTISHWSDPAQRAAWTCRAVFLETAARNSVGPLGEDLKWGQPAWRPVKPRTGSTLRMDWSQSDPHQLALFVDCKTDLAERMRELYPDLPSNDGRRRIAFDLRADLPEQAVSHLAQMTFTYHLKPALTG
ncbi:hypothetical protein Z946_3627 [Sulfitobacter noctilucicola]|uniref:YdhG-like domain-containing protein n=1 Tax=Sulfitobacter noctilucicola TaxID=1342301 RepID=A0A7W6M7Z9_9RHOB|nr:hypothetical protein [Sulfitobacter noctilucicola]KIN64735.1 hypothetical protein Z946_3627 [Sulfitobacter noctilucicola]MBB4174119.1 hypothetical protein [Sulfitobacter noctilucicola]